MDTVGSNGKYRIIDLEQVNMSIEIDAERFNENVIELQLDGRSFLLTDVEAEKIKRLIRKQQHD